MFFATEHVESACAYFSEHEFCSPLTPYYLSDGTDEDIIFSLLVLFCLLSLLC